MSWVLTAFLVRHAGLSHVRTVSSGAGQGRALIACPASFRLDWLLRLLSTGFSAYQASVLELVNLLLQGSGNLLLQGCSSFHYQRAAVLGELDDLVEGLGAAKEEPLV